MEHPAKKQTIVQLSSSSSGSNQSTNKLYSVTEALNILGIKRTHFYHLLKNERIRALKIGRRTLIPEEQLTNFISSLISYSNHPQPPPK